MADVPLLPGSCLRRLVTTSHQSLTAGFSLSFPSAVSSRADLTSYHLSTNSLTPSRLTVMIRLTPGSSRLLYKISAWTAQKTLLLMFVTWHHVFHCSIAASCRTAKKTLLLAVASLLHDVTVSTKTLFTWLLRTNRLLFSSVIACLLCCDLATDSSFCLTCHMHSGH
jgi:hypothetical protein